MSNSAESSLPQRGGPQDFATSYAEQNAVFELADKGRLAERGASAQKVDLIREVGELQKAGLLETAANGILRLPGMQRDFQVKTDAEGHVSELIFDSDPTGEYASQYHHKVDIKIDRGAEAEPVVSANGWSEKELVAKARDERLQAMNVSLDRAKCEGFSYITKDHEKLTLRPEQFELLRQMGTSLLQGDFNAFSAASLKVAGASSKDQKLMAVAWNSIVRYEPGIATTRDGLVFEAPNGSLKVDSPRLVNYFQGNIQPAFVYAPIDGHGPLPANPSAEEVFRYMSNRAAGV